LQGQVPVAVLLLAALLVLQGRLQDCWLLWGQQVQGYLLLVLVLQVLLAAAVQLQRQRQQQSRLLMLQKLLRLS
jgi:hypothetical protein